MTQKKQLHKPSELLNLYSRQLNTGLEEKISPLGFELNLRYRNPEIALIAGYVIFRSGWIIEFNEVIRQLGLKVVRVKYRYHVMDQTKSLIFRYDNVPHFPHIKTHPDHKHTGQDVIASSAPGLLEVIDEVEKLILKDISSS